MEPVISFARPDGAAPHDPEPADAPHGAGPGFAAPRPDRPRSKVAGIEASEAAAMDEERETAAKIRDEAERDETGDRGSLELGDAPSDVAPASPLQVGDGRQADDADGEDDGALRKPGEPL